MLYMSPSCGSCSGVGRGFRCFSIETLMAPLHHRPRSTRCRPARPSAPKQSIRELSQKQALAAVRRDRLFRSFPNKRAHCLLPCRRVVRRLGDESKPVAIQFVSSYLRCATARLVPRYLYVVGHRLNTAVDRIRSGVSKHAPDQSLCFLLCGDRANRFLAVTTNNPCGKALHAAERDVRSSHKALRVFLPQRPGPRATVLGEMPRGQQQLKCWRGGVLAGLVIAVPQLIRLSDHKPLVFGIAGTLACFGVGATFAFVLPSFFT
jgi:hypothetical protein